VLEESSRINARHTGLGSVAQLQRSEWSTTSGGGRRGNTAAALGGVEVGVIGVAFRSPLGGNAGATLLSSHPSVRMCEDKGMQSGVPALRLQPIVGS